MSDVSTLHIVQSPQLHGRLHGMHARTQTPRYTLHVLLTRLAKTHDTNTRNIYLHSTRLIIVNVVMPTEKLSQYICEYLL